MMLVAALVKREHDYETIMAIGEALPEELARPILEDDAYLTYESERPRIELHEDAEREGRFRLQMTTKADRLWRGRFQTSPKPAPRYLDVPFSTYARMVREVPAGDLWTSPEPLLLLHVLECGNPCHHARYLSWAPTEARRGPNSNGLVSFPREAWRPLRLSWVRLCTRRDGSLRFDFREDGSVGPAEDGESRFRCFPCGREVTEPREQAMYDAKPVCADCLRRQHQKRRDE